MERRVDRPYQTYVDKQILVDKYVDVPVERRVDVDVEVEKRVEVPYQTIVEKPVYHDKYVDIPNDIYVEKPYDVERTVEYEVERRVPKYVEEVIERFVDVPVVKEIEVPVEKVVEKIIYIDKIVEKPVPMERIIEVPVERYVDKEIIVEKIVEKPVYIEKRVEKPVERIVEKYVEVPYEKFVEVPVERIVEKFIEVETVVEKPVYLEKVVETNVERKIRKSTINDGLRNSYRVNVERANQLNIDVIRLRNQVEELRAQGNQGPNEIQDHTVVHGEQEYRRLQKEFEDLRGQLDGYINERKRISTRQSVAQGPSVQDLEEKIALLAAENNRLQNDAQ